MDAKLIEKLDRLRYQSLLMITISLPVFGFMVLTGILIPTPIPGWIYACSGVVAAILFIVGYRKERVIRKEIKKSPELAKVLNNELIQLYRYKSLKNAVLAITKTCLLFYILSPDFAVGDNMLTRFIPTVSTAIKVVSMTLLLVGFLIMMISLLVYLRK
jgi:hypothetical protein